MENESDDGSTESVQTTPIWGYARGYDRFMREGHLYPAPTCGSPSIIWHVALAPRRRFGDYPGLSEPWIKPENVKEEDLLDWDQFYNRANNFYDQDFKFFIDELNALALRLQEHRVAPNQMFQCVKLESDANYGLEEHIPYQFLTATPQTLSFPIWWPDPEMEKHHVDEENWDRFLRVHVQIQTHTGFATINFIIDASKPYGKEQIERPEEDELDDNGFTMLNDPIRRNRIRRALNIVRCSSLKQIRERSVEKPRIPEANVEEDEARDLLAAADYLYKDIWEDFTKSFGLELLATKERSERELYAHRFADLRGHVMSITGLDTEELDKLHQEKQKIVVRNAKPDEEEQQTQELRTALPDWKPGFGFELADDERPHPVTGFDGFGRFYKFDSDRNEGHTVLRSLWPFIRRISPWADYRELVGCGLMNWRALYVSTLGFSSLDFRQEDEAPSRSKTVPNNHLPVLEQLWRREKLEAEEEDEELSQVKQDREASKPIRFLIVTKGEPQREQLGRLVERLTYMETLRVFSLKDIVMIRNAGTHLEVVGRMLDGLLGYWSLKRKKVEDERDAREAQIEKELAWRRKLFAPVNYIKRLLDMDIENYDERIGSKWAKARTRYVNDMNKLIRETDGHIINLAATLDNKIGAGGTGRVLYAIRRSELSTKEYDRLLPTLSVGDIDGWISYPQFVTRSLVPSFDFIEHARNRLISLKKRMDNISQTIQAATLILEAEATRLNTDTLTLVARYFSYTRWTITVGLAILVLFAIENTEALNWKPVKVTFDFVKDQAVNLLKYSGLL